MSMQFYCHTNNMLRHGVCLIFANWSVNIGGAQHSKIQLGCMVKLLEDTFFFFFFNPLYVTSGNLGNI